MNAGGPGIGDAQPAMPITGALLEFTRDETGRVKGFLVQDHSHIRNLPFIRQP